MNLSLDLTKILENTDKLFNTDELAYLAITSKIENPLRDKIAYQLHNEIGENYLVCREWKGKNKDRTDIAILDSQTNNLKCLIEIKAHSVPKYEYEYQKLMKSDLLKMCENATEDTELYYIFFNNHFDEKIILDEIYSPSIKYFKALNKVLSTKSKFTIADIIDNAWLKYLSGLFLSIEKYKKIEIKAGAYYNRPISIIAFVYGPLYKKDLLHLS